MANVAHKNLTGTDIHEPKGMSGASLNTVYVCTTAGTTGTWQKIGVNQLDGAGKAFQGQLLHVRDEKSSGVDGGTFTSGAWRTRTLNTTKTNEITGASLTSNQITLPAGTYWIEASAPGQGVDFHQAKLRNVTDGSDVIIGTTENTVIAGAQGANGSRSIVQGRFTIAAEKVFELQHRCSDSTSSVGFGAGSGFGVVEVYAEVCIWKVG
jgi:hypothetical protein